MNDPVFYLDFCPLQHAERVILRHRYLYYVEGAPQWDDLTYDKAERLLKRRFPASKVIGAVGSSNANDYPQYIQDGRRPNRHERKIKL